MLALVEPVSELKLKNLPIILALLLTLVSGLANACSCGEFSIDAAFRSHNHVFVGEVVENTSGFLSLIQGMSSISRKKVAKAWKGKNLGEFTIRVPLIRNTCNLRLKEKTSYLMFLSDDKPYRLMLCSGSKALGKVSKEWISSLDRLALNNR